MTLDELNELDFSTIGDWPIAIKVILIVILCGLLSVGWYFFDIEAQYKELERVERLERDLRDEFERKQSRAANLEAYRAQLAEMKETFGAMLRQLPNKTEVADLLVDVSQTGLASGLEFSLFQPQKERPKEFYAELPIRLTVSGSYHQFGEFVSGLAALPRIVTVHDITIAPVQKKAQDSISGGDLKLEAMAKTYRYLDGEGG